MNDSCIYILNVSFDLTFHVLYRHGKTENVCCKHGKLAEGEAKMNKIHT